MLREDQYDSYDDGYYDREPIDEELLDEQVIQEMMDEDDREEKIWNKISRKAPESSSWITDSVPFHLRKEHGPFSHRHHRRKAYVRGIHVHKWHPSLQSTVSASLRCCNHCQIHFRCPLGNISLRKL